jgi:hypothetical protein
MSHSDNWPSDDASDFQSHHTLSSDSEKSRLQAILLEAMSRNVNLHHALEGRLHGKEGALQGSNGNSCQILSSTCTVADDFIDLACCSCGQFAADCSWGLRYLVVQYSKQTGLLCYYVINLFQLLLPHCLVLGGYQCEIAANCGLIYRRGSPPDAPVIQQPRRLGTKPLLLTLTRGWRRNCCDHNIKSFSALYLSLIKDAMNLPIVEKRARVLLSTAYCTIFWR